MIKLSLYFSLYFYISSMHLTIYILVTSLNLSVYEQEAHGAYIAHLFSPSKLFEGFCYTRDFI